MDRTGMPQGTDVGGYRIVSPLGRGGMGAVYRAVDGAGDEVALKVLHPHLAAEPDARERLRREVAHLQRVRHPGVARVLDAEIESHEAFVVTELLDGRDLGARVRADGPLAPDDLLALAEQLRVALDVVHRAGLLHRDLTPGNVLMTGRGPVLIDFGIAQAVEDARVTSTGMVTGTPGYLPPEVLAGGEPSRAGDWWGWAAVLAFAATGRAPFGDGPVLAVLDRVRAGEVDLAGLDHRTATALRAALDVDPARRASPPQVVHELRRAAAGDGLGEEELGGPFGTSADRTQVVAADGGTRVMPVPASGAGARTERVHAEGRPDDTAVIPAHRDGPAGYDGYGENGYGEDRYGEGGYGGDAGYRDHRYDDDRYDDGGYEDGGDHRDGDDGVGAEPDGEASASERDLTLEGLRAPRRRSGSVLALGALLVALGAVRPGVALALGVLLAVLARSVGLDVRAVQVRRARRGPGRWDLPGAVAGWPWYLLRAVLGVLASVLVATSVVVLVGGIGWWLVGSGRLTVAEPAPGAPAGELAGNAAWVVPALLALVTLAGLLTVWFGPMSRSTRLGARWVLGAVAPGGIGAATLVLLALAATVLVVLTTFDESVPATVWWPLPGPPDLG